MVLRHLRIQRLRNISCASLELDSGVNLVVGGNGAGKTSILEADFLLGRGRSFRGDGRGGLVQAGSRDLDVVGVTVEPQRSVSVHRDRSGTIAKIDGKRVGGRSGLFEALPVRWIGENAQRLVEGLPEQRRVYLDWNMFHMEPIYQWWGRLHVSLKQRNACLQQGGGEPLWNEGYVEASGQFTALRKAYCAKVGEVFCEPCARHEGVKGFGLSLREGWPRSSATSGKSGRASTLLVDDVGSELDSESAHWMLGVIRKTGCQVIISGLTGDASVFLPDSERLAMFHVEQGQVSKGCRREPAS